MFCLIMNIAFKLYAQHIAAADDRVAVHGMLVFGKQHIYASHLPMFHAPHHYQVIWQVQLPKAAKDVYAASRNTNRKESVYTLAPGPFILPNVLHKGVSFKAVLFRGHFEQGGIPITDSVSVTVQEVFVFNQLRLVADSTFIQGYYVLGTRKEAFAIHRIGGLPSYDHVVQVRPPKAIFEANSGLGQLFTLLPIPNAENKPCEEKEKAWPTQYSVSGRLVELQPIRRIYLEFDDLR